MHLCVHLYVGRREEGVVRVYMGQSSLSQSKGIPCLVSEMFCRPFMGESPTLPHVYLLDLRIESPDFLDAFIFTL